MSLLDKDDPKVQSVLSYVDRCLDQLAGAPLGDTAARYVHIDKIKQELAKLTAEEELPPVEEVPKAKKPATL